MKEILTQGIKSLTVKKDGFNRNHRKEDSFANGYKVVTIEKETGDISTPIDCRIYFTKTRCYCAIWIHTAHGYMSATGYAGGYGYHKESAAVQDALSNMGLKLNRDINGVGSDAIEVALLAIAKELNTKENVFIHLIKING